MTNAKKMDRAETGPEPTVDNRVGRTSAETDRMPPEPRHADQRRAGPTQADAMPAEQPADQKQVEPRQADTRQVERPKAESASSADTARGPLAAPGAGGAPDRATAGRRSGPVRRDTGLIAGDDVERYRNDWRSVQSGFVDDPAGSVREADALVGRLFDTIASRIAQQRSALAERRPDESADRTEQLRLALRDYRTMFEQLLPGQRG